MAEPACSSPVYYIYGLSGTELELQASILRAEAPKIVSWRGKEMINLLAVPGQELTADRIIEAMALRDEYFSNQYHKIWLLGAKSRFCSTVADSASFC